MTILMMMRMLTVKMKDQRRILYKISNDELHCSTGISGKILISGILLSLSNIKDTVKKLKFFFGKSDQTIQDVIDLTQLNYASINNKTTYSISW